MTGTTGYILTRNEEDWVEAALESLQWCDEIIVLDSQSTDRTVEIAEKHADKVLNYPPEAEFDRLRKEAIEHATHDWIIEIDADERLSKSAQETLQETIDAGEADVLKIARRNYRYGTWLQEPDRWPDYTIVAYDRRAIDITGTLHDFFHIHEDTMTHNIPPEEGHITHFSILDVSENLEKINRYTSVQATRTEHGARKILKTPYTFLRKYLRCGLYRYGATGFLVASMDALYNLILGLKTIQRKYIGQDTGIKKAYHTLEKAS